MTAPTVPGQTLPGEPPAAVTVELADADATRAYGRALAGLLRAGDLVVLTGDLGAGKTTLTQGIGAGLGSLDEVEALDLDASLEDSVTVVEWGEGLVESLAADRLEISIRRPRGGVLVEAGDADEPEEDPAGGTRTVTARAVGARWAGICLPS